MAHFGCIFAIWEIFLQFKGGGPWPKWPNDKYATGGDCQSAVDERTAEFVVLSLSAPAAVLLPETTSATVLSGRSRYT